MIPPDVLAYYERLGEVDRLTGAPIGRLEFLRTWDVLRRALPPAPARILDVGGATGGYARPLAAAGYRVCIVDPVPAHVAHASAARIAAVVGDARHLPVESATADAVLLLGPLYHLVDRSDRVAAWREAARAVRPGGPVVAATISRYASALDGFMRGTYADPRVADVVAGALATGEHRPPAGTPWFATAYFHHPGEPAAEAADAGLAGARTVHVEGPVWLLGRLEEILADERETAWLLEVLRRLEAESSVLGASSHLVTVARRPGPVGDEDGVAEQAVRGASGTWVAGSCATSPSRSTGRR